MCELEFYVNIYKLTIKLLAIELTIEFVALAITSIETGPEFFNKLEVKSRSLFEIELLFYFMIKKMYLFYIL